MPEQPLTVKRAFSLIEGVRSKIGKMDREIRSLKDMLNTHDNWNALVRLWIGKEITVKDNCGEVVHGVLKWTDRYNLAIKSYGKDRVFTKGGIVYVERNGD